MTESHRQRPRNAIVYNMSFATPPAAVNPASSLSACVKLLRQSHENVLKALSHGPSVHRLEDNLISLRLAEAFFEKAEMIRNEPDLPLQIAVIGPTQSGKSSLVNLMLGEGRARVSPLAGYTVHPQGFPLNTGDKSMEWLDAYFHDYRRCALDELPEGEYGFYALDRPFNQPSHRLPASIIWDTPDFDSVDAMDYRTAVLRTAALADVILLVVSKDKYADQSVWDIMGLLEPLAQPTVACLNKLNAVSRDTLVRSMREKWRAARRDEPPKTAVLPWVDDPHGAFPEQEASVLLAMLGEACGKVDRRVLDKRAKRLAEVHWQDWLAPIRQELSARTEWEGMVDVAMKDALAIYRRDFLDNPLHFETFQRALAELLTLLEIPGLAGGMVAARKIITWPVRQLTRLGKTLSGKHNLGQETMVINNTMEHLFIQLLQGLLDRGGMDGEATDYWRELGRLLKEETRRGEAARAAAIARHVQDFQPEIERTAHQLHDKLQEHPAVLNTLRATRVTADAVALGLALHTGGIGVQDFIIAPAILSVTSLMTESTLGHFLQRAEAELKERQFKETKILFEEILGPVLKSLPDRLNQAVRFNIPVKLVDSVEEMLFGG
ncbi:MAG: GTPase [Candidatus Methylumidiphilus sp.]